MPVFPGPSPVLLPCPNGIRLVVTPNPNTEIISAWFFLDAGSVWEAPEQRGVAHLLAAVLTKGTHQWSSLAIAEQVESLGAGLGTDATNDYFVLNLKTVAADFPKLFALAAELLRFPAFPEAEVDLERRSTLQAIYAQQEQPFALAFEQLQAALYRYHPYGCSSLGTIEAVSQLDRQSLQQFHQHHFRPEHLVISLAGCLTLETAWEFVDRHFGSWQPPALPRTQLTLPEVSSVPCWVKHPHQSQQAIVALGYLACAVHHPDYVPLKLLATYLGNGMSSRLFVTLREQQGLAYEVSAFYPTRGQTSSFVTYMGTSPQNAGRAIAGLRQEGTRLRKVLLTSEEIQGIKNKLLGQYTLGKQTNAQLAHLFGWYEILGLGLDFDLEFQEQIRAVTPEELKEVADRYFDRPFVSVVGPQEILEKLGEDLQA